MTISYIFKIIVVGSQEIGKASFVKGDSDDSYFDASENCFSIGVSFKIVKIHLKELNTVCKFQLWNFKGNERFIPLYKDYNRGSSACLLCFDVSKKSSFEDLSYWIRLIKSIDPLIPIFLVGLKSDLKTAVSKIELEYFLRINTIDKVFFYSQFHAVKRNQILYDVGKFLVGNLQEEALTPNITSNRDQQHERRSHEIISKSDINLDSSDLDLEEKMEQNLEIFYGLEDTLNQKLEIDGSQTRLSQISEEEVLMPDYTPLRELIDAETKKIRRLSNLTEEEINAYMKFLDYFSTCPICHKRNHESYLKKFYFSMERSKIEIRKRLLHLMKNSNNIKKQYLNKIKLGVPCCTCFKAIFEGAEE